MQVLLITRVSVNYVGLVWSDLYLGGITHGGLVIMNEHQKDLCSNMSPICSKYVTYHRVNTHKGQYLTQLGERMLSTEEKEDLGFDPLQILHLKRRF